MLVCAIAVTPVLFVQWVDRLWPAVLLIGIATAAHQAFSANLLTLPSDLFPRRAVGSVIGIAGAAGALGGMVMAKYAGFVLDALGSYAPIFAVAGSAYILALLALHLLSPGLCRSRRPVWRYSHEFASSRAPVGAHALVRPGAGRACRKPLWRWRSALPTGSSPTAMTPRWSPVSARRPAVPPPGSKPPSGSA
jgi:MFS family permease